MVKFLNFLALSLVLFSCREVKPGKPEKVENQNFETKVVELDYVSIYEGNVPCADCSGSFQRLVLKTEKDSSSNGVFRLKETFNGKLNIEDGISEVITTGEFRKTYVKKENKTILEIADPSFADTAARVRSFLVENNELALFKDDNIKMNQKLYRLKKIRSLKL